MMFLRFCYILLLSITVHTASAHTTDSLYRLGCDKAKNGNYLEAEQIFATILQAQPDDTAVLCRHGIVLKQLERYPAAIAEFNKVLSRYPYHTRSLHWRAQAYNMTRRYALAIADMDTLIRLQDPYYDSLAYCDRAVYKENHKDLEGAIKDYEKAIAIAPGRATNHAYLADLLGDMNRYAEGIEAYTKAIQLNPGEEEYYEDRADMLVKAGKDSAAIPDYDKAFSLSATDADRSAYILDARAMCKYRLADYPAAIRDFNMVSSTYGSYKQLHYYRGLAKIAMGNKSSGCDDLAEAKRLKMKGAKDAIKNNCK